MSELHPHWRATGDRPAQNPNGSQRLRIDAETKGVSRAPAAVVGIIAVLGLGITFFHGWDDLLSQIPTGTGSSVATSSSSSSVSALVFHVTVNGMSPRTAIASAGDTVTITNDDTLPHIFSSSTLRDGSGVVLTTQVIFPGLSEQFTIYPSEVSGDHVITSATTPTTKATITILPPQASSSSKAAPFGTLDDVKLPTGGIGNPAPGTASTSSSSSKPMAASGTAAVVTNAVATASSQSSAAAVSSAVASSAAPVVSSSKAPVSSSSSAAPVLPAVTQETTSGADGIPVNPYTIATVTHAAASASDVKTSTKDSAKTNVKASLHSGANLLAKQQPKTGPEVWIAIAGSVTGLLLVTRRQLQAIVRCT